MKGKSQDSPNFLKRLEEVKLHFIITFGRSGSTLLQSMLNGHPQVLATLEQQFFLVNYRYFHKKTNWVDKDIALFVENIWLRKKEMAYLWKIDEDLLIRQLKILREHHKLTYRNACKLVYMNHYQFNNDIKMIIDKNPIYLAHVDKIIEVFPEAKMIVLLRDYRGFFASIKAYESKPFQSNYPYILGWKIGANRFIPQLDQIDFQIVRYDNLLNQTEQEVQKICAFLSIDYDASMLNYRKANLFLSEELEKQDAFLQKNIHQNHGNINKAIMKGNEQKWKSRLSIEEIKTLEILLGEEGKTWEYKPSQVISTSEKKWFYLKNAPILLFNYLKVYIFIDYIYRMPFYIHQFIVKRGKQIINSKDK